MAGYNTENHPGLCLIFVHICVRVCVRARVCLRIPKLQQNETSILILIGNMQTILQTEFYKQ
jgi:hypothetical protein